jgi:choline dehydrogenase-like flavoprotein
MQIAADNIPPGQCIRAGVCIIGAGPVGLTIARELSGRADVLVLERGSEATVTEPVTDGLVLADPPQLVMAPRGRGNRRGWVPGEPYPLAESRARGIGGSSWTWAWRQVDGHWQAQLPPMDAADFEASPAGLSGWPIAYRDVAACFERAAEHCRTRDFTRPAPASWLAPRGIFAKHYQTGPSDAFWSEAADALRDASGVTVMTGAYALELLTTAEGRAVTGVRVASQPGREFTVAADLYVLAAGAIENARVLLASRSAPHAEGIGNADGMVGRCFMEHLNHDVGFLVPRDRSLLADEHLYGLREQGGTLSQWKYQLDPELRRSAGLPNVVYQFSPVQITGTEIAAWYARHLPGRKAWVALRTTELSRARIPELLRELAADAPALLWGRIALAAGKAVRIFDNGVRALAIRGSAEQYPDPACRVLLTGQQDDFGVPVAALDWRASARDLGLISASQRQLAEVLEQAGVGTLFHYDVREDWLPHVVGVGFHHMGTTRMSDSPTAGVVDRDCRVHGVGNLYAAGTSVFSTGGSANPTFTAVALAVRLARHLAPMVARPSTQPEGVGAPGAMA